MNTSVDRDTVSPGVRAKLEGHMDIAVEDTVQCPDGPAGQVTQLVVNRASMRLTHIVVKEACRPYAERKVPFRFVQHSAGDQIRLQCSRQELSTMQLATRTDLVESEAFVHGGSSSHDQSIYGVPWLREVKHQNLAETECALGANTRARATDGNAGRLLGLTLEPASGDITHLLFQQGPSWATRTLALPIAAVAEVGSEVVYVRSSRDALAALPPARAPTVRSSRR